MTDFAVWSRAVQARMESVLGELLPAAAIAPEKLHAAMRYATLGGGKRVRPMLAHAAGEAVGAEPARVDLAAAAVEFIHVYSLTHDDLPCMDDDDLRRGKPTCHVAYDEATAMLVGDALQSLAFETLARPEAATDATVQVEMLRLLARASGSRGMCGGQAVDLEATGRALDLAELEFMHIHKTGALIQAATLLGAMAGGALTPEAKQGLERYARAIGLAFQVMDDVLDAETDTATLGKTAGKDAAQGKATYLTLMNVKEARAYARELMEDALTAIQPFGDRGGRLAQIARFIVERGY